VIVVDFFAATDFACVARHSRTAIVPSWAPPQRRRITTSMLAYVVTL
jgi:hypothetical protein